MLHKILRRFVFTSYILYALQLRLLTVLLYLWTLDSPLRCDLCHPASPYAWPAIRSREAYTGGYGYVYGELDSARMAVVQQPQ